MVARARVAALAVVIAAVFTIGHAWALEASQKPAADPDAVFNTSSKIYHRPSCASARRCTRNCIVIPLSQAQKRGRPCKVCGGPAVEDENLRQQPATRIISEQRGVR